MAGLVGYESIESGLLKQIDKMEADTTKGLIVVAQKAAKAGEDAARKTIYSTASSLSPGKPDRNWTHQMEKALSNEVVPSADGVMLRSGWLALQEGYFLLQEDGGQGPRGITITPMHALQAAYDAMRDELALAGVNLQ
jgi:hypothetical protein